MPLRKGKPYKNSRGCKMGAAANCGGQKNTSRDSTSIFKTLLKGNNLQSERGVNSILSNLAQRYFIYFWQKNGPSCGTGDHHRTPYYHLKT